MLSNYKTILPLLVLLSLITACGSPPAPDAINAPGLYANHCANCHGSDAQGIFNLAPCLRCEDLFTTHLEAVGWSRKLDAYLTSVISIGRIDSTRPDFYPGAVNVAMPGFVDSLSEADIAALVTYLLAFESEALGKISQPDDLPSELETRPDDQVLYGLVMFRRRGCVSCHAVSGISSGTAGPSLDGLALRAADRIVDYSAEEYIRESIISPGAYVVPGFASGVMPQSFNATLDFEELDALITFLLSLD